MLGEVMCSTLHDNTPVEKGETVAATRLIPLVASRELIAEAEKIALSSTPIVEVFPLKKVKIGLVITGNEVFYGRIEDRFEEVLRAKAADLGSEILMVRRAPDDKTIIAREIGDCIDQGPNLSSPAVACRLIPTMLPVKEYLRPGRQMSLMVPLFCLVLCF